jgi:hypothetical protein
MADTFLNYSIISDFLLPFLLVFFITFAILERTKLFGADKKQINALTAFVIGLIFVTAIYPKLVVSNLILFLTVTLVAVFVILLIWGFIFGETKTKLEKGLMMGLGIIATIVFIGAVIWATGLYNNLGSYFSGGTGSTIITNAVFLIVIGIALALVLIPKGK